ncbi:MAG: sulfatase family protein [Vicinamibacteria bacterium]
MKFPAVVCLLLSTLALEAEVTARPNLILIVTDDLDRNLGTLDFMPNLHRVLVQQGLTLSDFFVTNSLCCPSRATILRGQYTHSHQVLSNQAPFGGFEKFFQMGHEPSTLAVWLQTAGYRTILLGKYFNEYPAGASRTHRPPGWSDWASPIDGEPYKGFNYRMNENGRVVSYGGRDRDYLTDVLARKAADLLRHSGEAPFFLYLTPYAPHHPATPAPRHERLFTEAQVPRTPSFNEADVNDKPAPRSMLSGSEIEDIDALYRSRLRSMQAVDEMIGNLVRILEESGRLGNTYVFFTSDNGFHMGQHRLRPQKATPYEEDLRVPFIVRGPGVPAGAELAGYLAGNVDIAPTLLELAEVDTPHVVEGRSLAPLLRGERPAPTSWRQAYLIEQYSDEGLIAPSARFARPIFIGVRTLRYKYIEYWTGVREIYDLTLDPHELANFGGSAPPALITELSSLARSLATCVGAGCRAAEAVTPP